MSNGDKVNIKVAVPNEIYSFAVNKFSIFEIVESVKFTTYDL